MDPRTMIATEIDQVIVTLQKLNISASVDNMSTLLACLKILANVEQEVKQLELKEEIQNAESGEPIGFDDSAEPGNG